MTDHFFQLSFLYFLFHHSNKHNQQSVVACNTFLRQELVKEFVLVMYQRTPTLFHRADYF